MHTAEPSYYALFARVLFPLQATNCVVALQLGRGLEGKLLRNLSCNCAITSKPQECYYSEVLPCGYNKSTDCRCTLVYGTNIV